MSGRVHHPLLKWEEGPDSLLIEVTGGASIGAQFIPASELTRGGGRLVYWRTSDSTVYRTFLAVQFPEETLILPDSTIRHRLALPPTLSQDNDTFWLLYTRETALTAVSIEAYGNDDTYVCRVGRTSCPPAASGAVFSDQGPSVAITIRAYETTSRPPELSVVCTSMAGSSAITRGDTVTCTARVTPALPFMVVRQKAEAKRFRLEETPNVVVAPDSVHAWSGVAALDTKVTFEVAVTHGAGTKKLSKPARFTVTPRPWPAPQVRTPTTVRRTLDPERQMTGYPSNGVLGLSGPIEPGDDLNSAPVTMVDRGPNRGLGFLTDPYRGSGWQAYIHPGLDPVPAGLLPGQAGYELWHKWHDDQNGAGSGTCTSSVFPVLVPEVERHEGLTYAAASHHAVAEKAYAELKLAERLEEVVIRSSNDMDIRMAVWQEWKQFHKKGGNYRQRQRSFDNVDTPLILKALNCTLDHTESDK